MASVVLKAELAVLEGPVVLHSACGLTQKAKAKVKESRGWHDCGLLLRGGQRVNGMETVNVS